MRIVVDPAEERGKRCTINLFKLPPKNVETRHARRAAYSLSYTGV